MIKILTGPERKARSGKANKLLIIFHGYGSNGENLIDIADYFHFDNLHVASPNAPEKHPAADYLEEAYQWFSLRSMGDDIVYEGLESIYDTVKNFIDMKLKELNLSYKDLVLAGFSQGGMLALHLATRLDEKIAGAIGFSTTLIGKDKLAYNVKNKPPILLIHGNRDNVIESSEMFLTEKAFQELDFNVKAHLLSNLDHTINEEAIFIAEDFLKEQLV